MDEDSIPSLPAEERKRVLAAHQLSRQFRPIQPLAPEITARVIGAFRAKIGPHVYAVDQRLRELPRHPGELRGMLALGYEEIRAARSQSSGRPDSYDPQDDRSYR